MIQGAGDAQHRAKPRPFKQESLHRAAATATGQRTPSNSMGRYAVRNGPCPLTENR